MGQVKSKVNNIASNVQQGNRHSRINNIVIANVPEKKEEKIPEMIIKLGEYLNVEITKGDIDKTHRVNSFNKNQPKPTVARLVTNIKKTELMTALRDHFKNGNNLTARSLGIADDSYIFVNHHLASHMAGLHAGLRKLRKDHPFKLGYYEDSTIWVLLANQERSTFIKNEGDFVSLCSKLGADPRKFLREDHTRETD